ncbi:MAG: response regulator [Melioribacteraceae bacterium]|nr:response regulator [Melioribacteraceae bacterium]MCF8266165.1 response regulator [Melioribacteraceae bacterium]MCF8432397.1 response regulator [Melioribacteraceae bacterium]
MDKTILIVDDTPENIQILSSILKDYQKKVAINGDLALKIANSPVRPDLILLDIMMPGKDGYEVIKELKSNEYTKNIPVIFLTSKDSQAEMEKGLQLGAVDYLLKPFDSEKMLNSIHQILNN